jgi:uncharacterized protein YerC
MKVRARELDPKVRMRILDTLYTSAGTVRGRNAMKTFLKDVLTESERIMIGRRILIARELLAGKGYRDVASELGVGHDTISKVDHWLHDQMPGYEEAIKGLEREMIDRKMTARYSLKALKKKYPLHFLFF